MLFHTKAYESERFLNFYEDNRDNGPKEDGSNENQSVFAHAITSHQPRHFGASRSLMKATKRNISLPAWRVDGPVSS
jgi:hypothetical protein